MSQDQPTCPHCGEPSIAGSFFCASCGKATLPSEHPAAARKQTMMMGAVMAAPLSPADDPGRSTATGISQPPRGQAGRTMAGISPPPPANPTPAPVAASDRKFARTMVGGGGLTLPMPGAQPTSGAEPAPAFGSRTMVAGSMDNADTSATPPAEPRTGSPARTMLDITSDAPLADPSSQAAYDEVSVSGAPSPTSSAPPLAARSGSGLGAVRIILAVVAVLAAGGLGYVALRGTGPSVRVRVETSAEGESMLFEVPGAGAGSAIRFGGQEKKLSAGQARFALAPDSLRVGSNAVLYEVVQPGGDVVSGSIALAVDYRVTLDTAPLRAGKASVDVVVAALPGSKVLLDGEPLALDAQGRAVRSDPLQLDDGADRLEHVVRYRVQPPSGEGKLGELRTVIAVTSLQIDRPGELVVTDRDSIEIAGAVARDTRVSIDGKAIEVIDGRFLHRFPLPAVGEYKPVVTAASEGKAPRMVTLTVRRVEDLAKAAEGFDPDESLVYAKIVQNPAIYRGQRVAFEGRVYNVKVEGGRSALQVLVRECPDGQRCPLWVSYPAATDLTIDSWVRILGTVEGEQQFRAENDEVRSVPKVEAVFLLPAKP